MLDTLLKKLVARLPFRTITADGRPYLTRWYLWPPRPRGKDDDTSFAVFIHFFHRGDEDRDQHNHPWDLSASLILSGGYREERGNDVRIVRPGSINIIRGTDFHRVDLLEPSCGCWTLFVAGRRSQDWGFRDHVTGEFIPWRTYVS